MPNKPNWLILITFLSTFWALSVPNYGFAENCNAMEDFEPRTVLTLDHERALRAEAINSGHYVPTSEDAQTAARMSADVVHEFETLRQFPRSGRIPLEALIRILVSHGNAAKYSHSDSVRNIVRFLGDLNPGGKRRSVTRRLREYPNFVQAAIEAPDFPFHGFGCQGCDVETLPQVTDYLTRYIKMMKAETPDLPFAAVARSSSPVLYFDVIRKNPGLINGIVMISPSIPLKEWVAEASAELRRREAKGDIELNHIGLNWIDNILFQSSWDEHTLEGVPTLILTGSEDWEVTPKERQFLKDLAAKAPNITYVDVPGAAHDVLRQNGSYKKDNVLKTLERVEDFLSSLVHRQ